MHIYIINTYANMSSVGSLLEPNTYNLFCNSLTATQPISAVVTLNGVVTGPSNSNTIAAGAVTTAMTTATSTNTVNRIMARDNNGDCAARILTATSVTTNTINGNVTFTPVPGSGNAYNFLSFIGGTTYGYLFGNQPALGQGIHSSYNFYVNPSGNVPTITDASTGTSRITAGNNNVVLATGATNTTPTSKLMVDTDIRAQNGATFIGNLTGNASGSAATFTGSLSGVVTGTQSATTIAAGAITNAMLATINTPGKVTNPATTATPSNTASAIVARDANNGFDIGNVRSVPNTNAIEIKKMSACADSFIGTNSSGVPTDVYGWQMSGTTFTYSCSAKVMIEVSNGDDTASLECYHTVYRMSSFAPVHTIVTTKAFSTASGTTNFIASATPSATLVGGLQPYFTLTVANGASSAGKNIAIYARIDALTSTDQGSLQLATKYTP